MKEAVKGRCASAAAPSQSDLALMRDAHRIDEYKTTRHPALNDLIDELFAAVAATYQRVPSDVRTHVEVVVLNLFWSWCFERSAPAIRYSRGKDEYTGHRLSYCTLIDRTVPALEAAGFVKNYCGTHDGMEARLIATEHLLKRFEAIGSIPHVIEISDKFETIRLRTRKKTRTKKSGQRKKYSYLISHRRVPQLYKAINRLAEQLVPINDLLDRTFVGILAPDSIYSDSQLWDSIEAADEDSEEQQDFVTRPDFSKKHLYRVFNNVTLKLGTLTEGGRLYGGFWQWLPEKIRQRIWINDAPATEIDFSAMEVTLAYAQQGLDLQDHLQSEDPYLPPGADAHDRDPYKQILLTMLNSENRNEALGALLESDKTRELERTVITDRMSQLRRMHSRIRIYGKTAGMQRMLTESQIAVQILQRLGTLGIPALPIHDSFLVPKWATDEARAEISHAFHHQIGSKARLKVQPTLIPQDLTPDTVDPREYSVFTKVRATYEAKHNQTISATATNRSLNLRLTA